MIKTMIVEDEKPAREEIKYLINQEKDFKVLFEAGDGKKALEILNKNQVDLLFLDIKIPGISGMEIARILKEKKNSPYIVFTTAYDEYAVEAFQLAAVDYLLKPISDQRFKESLIKIKKEIKQNNNINQQLENLFASIRPDKRDKSLNKIAVMEKDYYLMLDFKDIYYFSTREKKVWAHCHKNSYMTGFQLKELERMLPEQFFRIHKSYIVNLKHIKAVIPWFKGKYQVLMEDYSEHKIPVSRSKVDQINKLLNLK
ncbi:LytTR family DNA-binding domain-containing protein [Halanaerobium sp. ST460_2HS_T2]|jgi:two-component system LytT family response regulator/two-component system response regulator LytT|uniref:LytR/AlgR family response regulator transcription factor n=1 Tax=Halanaerobium sp. ST460_2HS_T2 TaxID=2183914 RepID=UPI000DF369D7|nr:LytTR family DNA-binding domain-containing protein [Halanaerobium sp. ST460_2HS_T2]RCW62366.1 LytTR family two component transcriptional regulator [Halanaerobium sp. ST460_2HS_T2]